MKKGILFSGSRENAELAYNHVKEQGILYWCLAKPVNYDKYRFPITGLLHIKDEGVRYKCIINDIMPFLLYHFSDFKKKPESWVREQKKEKKGYKATFVITKVMLFKYNTLDLKNWNGQFIGNAPQGGYSKIIIPKKGKV